jgi:retron-type reverse transcriptase
MSDRAPGRSELVAQLRQLLDLPEELKAGVLEDGAVHPSEQGTPQGGSISVLLSNLYLHYVLDLWFERVVKGRLRSPTGALYR